VCGGGGGAGVKGGPGRFTIVSGSRRGSPGGGRRREEAAAAARAPFAPPDLGRCALSRAQASRSRRREGGSRCSHRRHHVLPRQEEHPADHGESAPSCPVRVARCAAGGAAGTRRLPWPRPRPRGETRPAVRVVERGGQSSRRGGRHTDGATLGFGGKQNKEETQTVARRTLDYLSSFCTAEDAWRLALHGPPTCLGESVCDVAG
jgi:hypothetical protein